MYGVIREWIYHRKISGHLGNMWVLSLHPHTHVHVILVILFFYVQPTFSFQFFTCVSFQISLAIERCPKFTFSTLTPDPDLHSPILAYPNLHNSNLHQTEPKFTQPKFTKPKFAQTRIYKFINPWLVKKRLLPCSRLPRAALEVQPHMKQSWVV